MDDGLLNALKVNEAPDSFGSQMPPETVFFHEMPRSKGALKKLQSTRNKRAGMDGKSENRYTINRSPFVHNLSKEAFGFAPRMFFERREVYCIFTTIACNS